MKTTASDTSPLPAASSHHVLTDIMMAEGHLEAAALVAKAVGTSDPTLSFQRALQARVVSRAVTG